MSTRRRRLLTSTSELVVLSLALALIPGWYAWKHRGNSAEDTNAFWVNTALSVATGFIGTAAGVWVGARVATAEDVERKQNVGPAVADAVAQLREEERLSPASARYTMVLAARVLGEEGMGNARASSHVDAIAPGKSCRVCTLKYETIEEPRGHVRCAHCRLHGKVWEGDEAITLERGRRLGRGQEPLSARGKPNAAEGGARD